jgi:uncharacterized repeat protein (TIGR03833 family)
MNGTTRANIKAGLEVLIVLKKDQSTGKFTKGIIIGHPDQLAHAPAWHQSSFTKRGGRAGERDRELTKRLLIL